MGKEDQDDETERNMANLRFRNPSSFCAHFDPPMSMMTTTTSSSQELDTDVARTDAGANENPRVNNRIKKSLKKGENDMCHLDPLVTCSSRKKN